MLSPRRRVGYLEWAAAAAHSAMEVAKLAAGVAQVRGAFFVLTEHCVCLPSFLSGTSLLLSAVVTFYGNSAWGAWRGGL